MGVEVRALVEGAMLCTPAGDDAVMMKE